MSLGRIDDYPRQTWQKKIPAGCLIDKDETVLAFCQRMSVLHLGAADAPFHAEKAGSGKLLHTKLQTVASDIDGVDLNAEAVAWLKSHNGIHDIIVGDATRPDLQLPRARYDVVVCCDIIEHTTNVGLLLDACVRYLAEQGLVIITTINATALRPALRALLHKEAVHPDHVAYFSLSTLCEACLRHGLTPTRVGYFRYPTVRRSVGVILDQIYERAPGTADGILVVAQRNSFLCSHGCLAD